MKILKEAGKPSKPKNKTINIEDNHIVHKCKEKTLQSPGIEMIQFFPPQLVHVSNSQLETKLRLDTVDEPTFARIIEAHDTINYKSDDHQQRCSKYEDMASSLVISLSTGTGLYNYIMDRWSIHNTDISINFQSSSD